MSNLKPKIVVTRKLPEAVEHRMAELFDAEFNRRDELLTREALIERAKGASVLVPTICDRIDGEVMDALAPNLRMIANFGAGVDHISVEDAFARGLLVTNTPGVLTEDTADLTMALIVSTPRRLTEGVEALRRGEFEGWTPTWMMGHRISGKKLGIIGLGRVGQAVARRAKAFNLDLHYHNRRRIHEDFEQELGVTYWESLDQMLARVDILSINCPHTPATYHLLSRRRLALMKPEAYIVNTARGEIIDEDAMIEMLEQGRLAGVGLDVFEGEPTLNPRLLRLKNATVVPHMGSATLESRVEMGERVIINIRAWVDGHRAPNRVIPDIL